MKPQTGLRHFVMHKSNTLNIALDVDSIGSQEPLTVEEQNQLSEYFSQLKNSKPILAEAKKKTKSKKSSK